MHRITNVAHKNKCVEIGAFCGRHPDRSGGWILVGNDLVTSTLLVTFAKVDFSHVVNPHDHVVALSVRAVNIGKRRIVAIGEQDIPREKQSDDRLQQAVLSGLFATEGAHRDIQHGTSAKTKKA